jgi:uracil-DNA glycosylase family 4
MAVGDLSALSKIERRIVVCRRCPKLRAYCARVARERKRAHAGDRYWGRPVPAFGDPRARVMLVGLAPGAHGSNRTGRMFTGDASGDFLFPALYRAGFASQPHSVRSGDGMRLRDCIITSAARCAPPQNKPTPQELRNCFPFLLEEFDALRRLSVMIGLGRIGFDAILKTLRRRGFSLDPARPAFAHGAEVVARDGGRAILAIASYHPSRQNTNTGKLTTPMFDAIFERASAALRSAAA